MRCNTDQHEGSAVDVAVRDCNASLLLVGLDAGEVMQTEAAAHERVRKWTKNVDIFDQDFVLVPIHDTAHWSLAIICQPGTLLRK